MLKHLPNALTLTRLVLAPVIAWAVWSTQLGEDKGWAVVAAVLFVIAALTDLFDGMAARAFHAESRFGRIIDTICY
jgi:phosphatidylglycerophosphate synthase